MPDCKDCLESFEYCICAEVDRFFEDNRELMDDLAKQEEGDKLRRCDACMFSPCRCASGLAARLSKL